MSNKVFTQMREMAGTDMLTLPPRSHEFLEGKIIDYVEGESITLTFPLYEKYSNPVGMILGGFIPLFFDSTMGPLSYLLAKRPASSLDLNTVFIRPLAYHDEEVKVTASLVNMSRSYILLEGKAWNRNGKLVATATSRMKILEIPS